MVIRNQLIYDLVQYWIWSAKHKFDNNNKHVLHNVLNFIFVFYDMFIFKLCFHYLCK
jgi:hypothetical protein